MSLPAGTGGGAELAGNVLVGVGIGWLSQHFFPGIAPWGYAVGIVLGAVSGFWQILKRNGAFDDFKKGGKPKKDEPGDPQP